MLPKVLGVAERAWNAQTDWATETDFANDFDKFYSIVVMREMPIWEKARYVYKKR